METTFVIRQSELNTDFLASLKKLFKHQQQLQITISVPEDFNLLQNESPKAYLARLEKCLDEMNDQNNTITFSEAQLDDMIIDKL